MEVLLDAEDLHLLSAGWHLSSPGGRSKTNYVRVYVAGKREYLHRVVMRAGKGQRVDHINGNGLDNRKDNLRLSTPSQNNCNSRKQSNNTSGHKGVSWRKSQGCWVARVVFQGRAFDRKFANKDDAVSAVKEMRREIHAEFAKDG